MNWTDHNPRSGSIDLTISGIFHDVVQIFRDEAVLIQRAYHEND